MPADELSSGLELFKALQSFLLTNQRQRFSLEILPRGIEPTDDAHAGLLVDGDAVAIRKQDLIKVFLIARLSLLQQALSSERDSIATPDAVDAGDIPSCVYSLDRKYAAWVAQIYDPDHMTAANNRKKALTEPPASSDKIVTELLFNESLLTSPLRKHPKSSTLWYHRFWILKTFEPWQAGNDADLMCFSLQETDKADDGVKHKTDELKVKCWLQESSVVLEAANQHERNYHAFQYFHDISVMLLPDLAFMTDADKCFKPFSDGVFQLLKWCLQHPRDVSGLTCLSWILNRASINPVMYKLVSASVDAVKKFQSDLQWTGESIQVFLKSTEALA